MHREKLRNMTKAVDNDLPESVLHPPNKKNKEHAVERKFGFDKKFRTLFTDRKGKQNALVKDDKHFNKCSYLQTWFPKSFGASFRPIRQKQKSSFDTKFEP